MILTSASKRLLAAKRERRKMESAGYFYHEPDWRIIRSIAHRNGVIEDVKVHIHGKGIWVKTNVGGYP